MGDPLSVIRSRAAALRIGHPDSPGQKYNKFQKHC
jgi:hypothetical protein